MAPPFPPHPGAKHGCHRFESKFGLLIEDRSATSTALWGKKYGTNERDVDRILKKGYCIGTCMVDTRFWLWKLLVKSILLLQCQSILTQMKGGPASTYRYGSSVHMAVWEEVGEDVDCKKKNEFRPNSPQTHRWEWMKHGKKYMGHSINRPLPWAMDAILKAGCPRHGESLARERGV